MAPAWQQAEEGQLAVVCSELAIAATLVGPTSERDPDLEAALRNVSAAPEVQAVPATRRLWEETARLRAATGLRTPDALHAVTALHAECALFITNDADFRRVDGLPVAILDDLLAD